MRRRKFTNVSEVKRQSRETIGRIPGVRVIADKRRKKLKHKKPVREE